MDTQFGPSCWLFALDKMDKLIQRFNSIKQNGMADKNLKKDTVARIFHGILQNSGAWERAERLTDFLSFEDGSIAVNKNSLLILSKHIES